jgi:hypothetical protein
MYIKKRSRITVYTHLYKKKATCFGHLQAGYRTLNKKTVEYKKRREKIQVSLKSDETNTTLHEDVCTLVIISS